MTFHLKHVLRELHRRSLWQVLGVYVVASWFVLQVVDTLTSVLQLPDWFPPFALVLLLVGLPIVLATAFVQVGFRAREGRPPVDHPALAPHDPAPAEDAPASPGGGTLRGLLNWRNALGGGVLAFALWGFVAAGWVVYWGTAVGSPSAAAPATRIAIAVLPFEDQSSQGIDQYFADGVHEEILWRLSKIDGMRVISRTSVLPYRGAGKDVRTIAGELGVGFVLAGSVRREEDRVRVGAQLIDAQSDELLWSEIYERARDDVFTIQEELGRSIAQSLDVTLSTEEAEAIGARLTESPSAYDHYLRGRDWETRSRQEPDFVAALDAYGRALEADPGFALAHVRMGTVHSRMYWFGFDRSARRGELAEQSIARAFELSPGLPEAHLARAWHLYQVHRQHEDALAELGLAAPALGNTPEFYLIRGAIKRRQGRMEEAVQDFGRSLESNPRSAELAMDIGNTYAALGRHAEADRYLERALSINPSGPSPYWWRAWNHLLWTGDLEAARRSLEAADSAADRDAWRTHDRDWTTIEFLARRPEASLPYLTSQPDDWIPFQYGETPRSLLMGEAYTRLGDDASAGQQFQIARSLLEAELSARPEDGFLYRDLAWATARLGDHGEALRLARQALEELPASGDALLAPDFARDLAAIHVMAGDPSAAIDELERLLELPGRAVTPSMLRIDPIWDPLRDDSRFERLLVPN